jgi:tetratricopeptide (TPR) repeat protein
MILAALRRPDDEALPLARQSAQWLDKYLDTGSVAPAEAEQVMIALSNVGNRFRIKEQFDEALRVIQRGLDIGRSTKQPSAQLYVGALLLDTARIHRDRGALDEALQHYREAAGILEPPPGTIDQQGRTLNFARGLTEEGRVLGDDHSVNLARPEEALVLVQRAFRIVDEIAHQDPSDANSRGHLSTSGRLLANLLRQLDDRQALDAYDHVLRHLAEVTNNPRFRRDEVRALAGSSYPLQRLGRSAEARQRLDAAFDRLRLLKLYPADQVGLGSEADDALRALADFEVNNGNLARAMEIHQELLDRISAAKPNPENRLADAADLSRLYSSMAALQRRSGKADQASDLDTRRLKLWQHWERKLPNNLFVLRQLAATRVH